MTKGTVTRRGFIQRSAAVGAGALAGSIIGAPYLARAANPTVVKISNLAGGWSNIANRLLISKGFDTKHGLKLDVLRTYNRLGTYYADMIKGNIQAGIGTWDTFAKMNLTGAPMGMIGVVSTGTLAGLFTRDPNLKKIEDLRGKTLSAMQVSGTYKLTKTWALEFLNFDIEKEAKVLNAPNPPATITMVAADRADAALSWEHSLSTGLHKIPGSRVAININDFYREHTGRDQPYFAIGVNTKAYGGTSPDTIKRLTDMWADALDWIENNKGEFQAMGPSVKIDASILKTAMDSGRLQFKMRPMAVEKNREDVQFAANIMQKHGLLKGKLPASFYLG